MKTKFNYKKKMGLEILTVKTVIIGAGMSGISASVNLLENNYKDFMVFEALERIGGRICTQTTGKFQLEHQFII